MSTTATTRPSKSATKPLHTTDPQEPLGAGDSRVVDNLLPAELAGNAYEKLVEEVEWIRMMHRGMSLSSPFVNGTEFHLSIGGEVPRLVAQQGEILDDDGRQVFIILFTRTKLVVI
jgi:hypothetical protein